MISSLTRRQFAGTLAATSFLTARAYSAINGANDRLRIGVIGAGLSKCEPATILKS
jgi:hypothetical protein